jgi:hypothetical protein
MKFYGNVARRSLDGASYRMVLVNGLPALLTEIPRAARGQAPRLITTVDIDDDGRVARIYAVLATRKLTALDPAATETPAP